MMRKIAVGGGFAGSFGCNMTIFRRLGTASCDELKKKGIILTATLSLESANSIAREAVATAKRNGFNPITVCVMDAGGHIIAMQRMDGCSYAFPPYAQAKARTAVSLGWSSRMFRDKYTKPGGPVLADKLSQINSMVAVMHGDIASFPGGVVLRSKSIDGIEPGLIVGAVGVSGAAGDEDEYCALCGINTVAEALGLVSEPKTHSCSTVKDPQ